MDGGKLGVSVGKKASALGVKIHCVWGKFMERAAMDWHFQALKWH